LPELNDQSNTATVIITSISMLRKNTGIVIFVGKAARLVTRTIDIEIVASPIVSNSIELPDNKIAKTVTGVSTHPWIDKARAVQKSLLVS
jgi:hypothetical protein